MAKDDPQSNIGLADEVAGSSSANSTLPSSGPAKQKFTPTPGKPLLIQFNEPIKGIGAIISQFLVNNIPILESQAKLRAGDFITVVGVGLEVFDPQEWQLQRQGKAPVTMPVVDVAKNGKWVTLRVPVSAVSGLQENESLGLSFFSSQIGGRLRMLPIVLVYEPQDQATPPQKAVREVSPKIQLVKEPVVKPPQPKARSAEQVALGVVAEFINQTPEVFKDIRVRERILKALSLGSWQKISPADQKSLLEELAQVSLLNKLPESVKTAIEGMAKIPLTSVKLAQKPVGAVQPQKKPDQAEANEADDDSETNSEVLSNQTTEGETQVDLQSSLELVNKYIAENPLAISDIQTKQNIQTALRQGDLSNLSKPEHIVLQAVVHNMGLKSSGELKQASNAVRQASISQVAGKQTGSSAGQTSQTVLSNRTQATISPTVAGQGEVRIESEATASGALPDQSITSAEIATAKPTEVQGVPPTGEMSSEVGKIQSEGEKTLPADINLVGEYLDKTNSIPDFKGAKARILNVLAKGDLEVLPADDRKNLLEILQKINGGFSAPQAVKDSANKVIRQLNLPSQTHSLASVAESGTSQPEKPEEDIQAKSSGEIKSTATLGVKSKIKPVSPPVALKSTYEDKLKVMRQRETQLSGKGLVSGLSGKGSGLSLSGSTKVKNQTGATTQALNLKASASQRSKIKISGDRSSAGIVSNSGSVANAGLGESEPKKLPEAIEASASASSLNPAVKTPVREVGQPKPVPPVPALRGGEETQTDPEASINPEKLSPLERAELERQQQAEANLQKARELLVNRQGVKSFNVKEAEVLINKEIDLVLNRLAFLVWAGAIPSFGISIIIGAIMGDIIWLIGPRLVVSSGKIANWVMRKLPIKSPLNKATDLMAKIQPQLSLKVKFQIVLMNLIVFIVVFILTVIIVAILYDICSAKTAYLFKDAYNIQEYCGTIEGWVNGVKK